MMLRGLTLVSLLISIQAKAIARSDDVVEVVTSRGRVRGYVVDLGSDQADLYHGTARVFKGIPYAEPPIGHRRFKKPVPKKTFGPAVYDATNDKPACPQAKPQHMSEDCLYLNVFTPKVSNGSAASSALFPVMVWIHGGSFNGGSAKSVSAESAISNMVSRGIVVVVIQYRLGVLGFFTTHTAEFPPNLGMLDQVEALKFVRSEIRHFGGNPNQITLAGQSAGAISVSAHTYSPLSRGLFRSAIMHSGAVNTALDGYFGFSENSQQVALLFCNFTQADWNSKQFSRLQACLTNVPYASLVPYEVHNFRGWVISQDDLFMPGTPSSLAADRPKIPVLFGTMRDEYAAFIYMLAGLGMVRMDQIGRQAWMQHTQQVFSFLDEADILWIRNLLEQFYLPNGTADNDVEQWTRTISQALTGAFFSAPLLQDMEEHRRHGNANVFVFEMTHRSSLSSAPAIGAFKPVIHSADLAYLWPTKWRFAKKEYLLSSSPSRQRDRELVEWFGSTWSTFVKTGIPSSSWNTAGSQREYLEIGDTVNTMRRSYREIDQTVWNVHVRAKLGQWPLAWADSQKGNQSRAT